MTDRFKGFAVTLEENIRSDDAEGIISAIRHVKGVLSVKPVLANIDDIILTSRVKSAIREALYKAIDETK